MKPSYFSNEDFDFQGDDDAEIADGEVPSLEDQPDNQDEEGDEGAETMVIDRVPLDTSTDIEPGSPKQSAPLTSPVLAPQGFRWTKEDKSDDEGCDTSSEESDEGIEKKRKKKKKIIEQDLTAEMQTRSPGSVADFERHLLASPNSSFLWIQYMSFQLQLAEIDKAREIGRRAVQAINIREEQEKLNVWIALLNLENTYGTEESLETLFKDAARHNDAKTVYLRMANIFDQAGNPEVCSAEALISTAVNVTQHTESGRTVQPYV